MPRDFGLVVGFWCCFFFLFWTILMSTLTANFRLVYFNAVFFSSWNTAFGIWASLSPISYPHCEAVWVFHPGEVDPRNHPSHPVQVQLFRLLRGDTAQDQQSGKSSCFTEAEDVSFRGTQAVNWRGVWFGVLHLFARRWTLQTLVPLNHHWGK